MVSMRVVVGSSAVMSACALGKHEASALLQVTSSKHIQNAIQKMDTFKFKEDVSLLDMEEQLNEFKDHVAAVLQEPSTVSPEDIKLLTDMITLLDTTFSAELTRQKESDVTRYNTKRSQHVKCTTDKDKRMHSTTGDVTKEESAVSAKRDKHKGCRKAQKSFETFRSDAEKVGLATFGNAVGVDSGSVPEISSLCTKKDQWDTDKRVYKGFATVDHVALCSGEQKDFEDMTCTWLKSKLSTCIAYDECIADINLTNEKKATEDECTNRLKVEVVLEKTKCHLLHLSKVFANENSTNDCENVTVDNSELACSLHPVPAVSPCSSDPDISTPTLPSLSCLPNSNWITTEYSGFNVSYMQVTTCKIEEECILPTQIGTHLNSDGCIDSVNSIGCDFYDRHRDACSDYPGDNAPINCCACGGGSTRTCDAALDCSGHGTTPPSDSSEGCSCQCNPWYTGSDCSVLVPVEQGSDSCAASDPAWENNYTVTVNSNAEWTDYPVEKLHDGVVDAETKVGSMWLVARGNLEYGIVTFTLGSAKSVSEFQIWNNNQYVNGETHPYKKNRDAKNVDISYSTDGSTYTLVTTCTLSTQENVFPKSPTNPKLCCAIPNIVAQYWRITLKTFWITPADITHRGLAEVKIMSGQ